MKYVLLAAALLSAAPAFATPKRCEKKGLQELGRYLNYGFNHYKNYEVKGEADYYVGPNGDGEEIVQYQYDVVIPAVGARLVRITMLNKGCELLVADASDNKEAQEADDREAAQGGVSEE